MDWGLNISDSSAVLGAGQGPHRWRPVCSSVDAALPESLLRNWEAVGLGEPSLPECPSVHTRDRVPGAGERLGIYMYPPALRGAAKTCENTWAGRSIRGATAPVHVGGENVCPRSVWCGACGWG